MRAKPLFLPFLAACGDPSLAATTGWELGLVIEADRASRWRERLRAGTLRASRTSRRRSPSSPASARRCRGEEGDVPIASGTCGPI